MCYCCCCYSHIVTAEPLLSIIDRPCGMEQPSYHHCALLLHMEQLLLLHAYGIVIRRTRCTCRTVSLMLLVVVDDGVPRVISIAYGRRFCCCDRVIIIISIYYRIHSSIARIIASDWVVLYSIRVLVAYSPALHKFQYNCSYCCFVIIVVVGGDGTSRFNRGVLSAVPIPFSVPFNTNTTDLYLLVTIEQ